MGLKSDVTGSRRQVQPAGCPLGWPALGAFEPCAVPLVTRPVSDSTP